MNAKLVVDALRKRHGAVGREWAFFDELRAGTGYKNIRKGMNPEQRFDAWAINLYPSKGHMTIAYEVKVSRSDFLHTKLRILRNGNKHCSTPMNFTLQFQPALSVQMKFRKNVDCFTSMKT